MIFLPRLCLLVLGQPFQIITQGRNECIIAPVSCHANFDGLYRMRVPVNMTGGGPEKTSHTEQQAKYTFSRVSVSQDHPFLRLLIEQTEIAASDFLEYTCPHN